MTLSDRIIELTDNDIIYPFDSDPYVKTEGSNGSWGQTIYPILFPCYSHSKQLIEEIAGKVENIFPIGFPPQYFILPFDTKGQTNAWADANRIWADDKKNNEAFSFAPQITFSGKRIPLHPAITRYLVAHEYGHCVDWWINYQMGLKDEIPTQFDKIYAEMRGIEVDSSYGGRKWHTNIGEIIANDVRIAVFDIESEFWPHDCSHPKNDPVVLDFWKEQVEKYGHFSTME